MNAPLISEYRTPPPASPGFPNHEISSANCRGRGFWPLTVCLILLASTPSAAQVPPELSAQWFRAIEHSLQNETQTLPGGLNIEEPLASSASLARRLLRIDHISVRKQHLKEIVNLCGQLLMRIEASPEKIDASELTVELLYRNGRALGYMELPDVVALNPVEDPEDLHKRFESNFRRLAELTNTLQPKFILLLIRRERRRNNLAEALRLVEIYRKTHHSPTWYAKKRQDILFEMGMVAEKHAVNTPSSP